MKNSQRRKLSLAKTRRCRFRRNHSLNGYFQLSFHLIFDKVVMKKIRKISKKRSKFKNLTFQIRLWPLNYRKLAQ